jgi:hypothetical protein
VKHALLADDRVTRLKQQNELLKRGNFEAFLKSSYQ